MKTKKQIKERLTRLKREDKVHKESKGYSLHNREIEFLKWVLEG